MNAWLNKTHVGDCRELLRAMEADGVRVQTCVTSPPYFGLRRYTDSSLELGIEATPQEYVDALVGVFRAVRDVLADDGTLWLNIGDCYAAGKTGRADTGAADLARRKCGAGPAAGPRYFRQRKTPVGLKPKDLIGIPWMLAFALREDGWYLRSEIIWAKVNALPESVTDRPTKAHEQIFLLAKSERYYYDAKAIKEIGTGRHPGNSSPHKYGNDPDGFHRTKSGFDKVRDGYEMRNKRSVWNVASEPFGGAHFGCFPRKLIEPCVLAGSRPGDVVLDPFMGSGTTGQVATDLGRQFIGCELNGDYLNLHDLRRTTIGMPW